jgi:MFS family permease
VTGRWASLVAFAGTATALFSLLLAGIAGGPYLDSEHVNGWVIVFAAGLLAALVAAPMVIEARFRARRRSLETTDPPNPDPELKDERWESAALAWGGITLAVLAVAIPVGLAESFSGSSLAGTVALLATIEAGLVLLALLALLLAD